MKTLPRLIQAVFLCCALASAQEPVYRDARQPVEKRVDDLLGRMTLEEKIDMLGGFEGFSILPNDRLGIPKIVMADGPCGVRNYGDGTAFAAPISIAASWNTELMHTFGTAVGKEARAKGVHIMLAPGLNIYRAPMCGRNFEYLGEDPYLAGRMTAEYVKGVQSQGVVATAKHFAANNQEYDRYNVSSDVDERTLQEIYLPAFRAAVVEGGAGAVMTSYNLINGVHASQNDHLIRDILKGQWKFDGIVMSDWGSTWDGVAAANGGLDLEMPIAEHMNRSTLLPAIKDGKIKVATIDDKVRRMLRVMFRMGYFERTQLDTTLPRYSPESRLVAIQGAREGSVLLKNRNNALPFDRGHLRSIAVIGPDARLAVTGGGGSSEVHPFRSVGVLEGIIQTAGNGVRVFYGAGLATDEEGLIKRAVFASDGAAGLKGEYFSNMELEGKPALTRIDRQIDFEWSGGVADGFPKERYSVRWTGTVHVEEDGEYEFIASGDDGFRLFLDGSSVLNEWRDQAVTTSTRTMRLAGKHDYRIRLEFYQNGGDAIIRFGWGRAVRRIVPSDIALARKADAAVVCVGFTPSTEGEGSDRAFSMPKEQEELINAVASVNPRTVVVLIAGGNVSMTGWIENISGLLHAWYPGQEGGTAVGEILFGDVNPSGKLPASFEKRWEDNASFKSYYDEDDDKRVKYSEGVFVGYRHFDKDNLEPMFPFGYGLSYTTFEYGNLALDRKTMSEGGSIGVRFDVKNTGTRAGAEVAEVYVHQVNSTEPRPIKELKGFAKVYLEPGQKKTVSITLDRASVSYFRSKDNRWVAEPGEFEVLVGGSSRSLPLKGGFVLAAGH